MKRNIKLNNYEINARACVVLNKEFKVLAQGSIEEIEVSTVMAVDLKGTKALQMATGDFGMVIFNELSFGFMISWKEFELLEKNLGISEENYEEFLDNFTNDFSDTIIDYVSNLNK